MHTPQLIYLALMFVGFGITVSKHGQPETGKHNAWFALIANALVVTLLWWGGFFSQP
ncbi:hypothetical protein KNU94_gp47 [Xanthomonas phage FoX2]|uniref:Uncharacterized protein n=2 Tax=Foxunavirus TaxID=2948712 RepID=A0A858NPQ3_9CAUD|nr:hypothetical protein KNU94_gp47 [Xanthomonas phage FoX2]YP_010106931.1 lytic murein transglycosylase [Xanthomonas phage FoX5]QJB21885.1 hypothetical protein XccvBFoX2_gp66 [Xanthomonas phage FoX2]QJB22044.1 lytic murein transglycosylase [Xanthomonas phage FoX5]